jgi:hypothetical protein
MPTIGKPHHPLAMAFLKATFKMTAQSRKGEKSQEIKTLQRFLARQGRSVAYADWPIVRELNQRLDEIEEWGPSS